MNYKQYVDQLKIGEKYYFFYLSFVLLGKLVSKSYDFLRLESGTIFMNTEDIKLLNEYIRTYDKGVFSSRELIGVAAV
jgi:hypothetical protein